MSLHDVGRNCVFHVRGPYGLGLEALQAPCAIRQPCAHAGMVRHIDWSVVSFPGAAMRRIEVNWSSLKQTKPHEYAVRFLFGGFSTVAAGLIAKRFGPGVGGLFLAVSAVFSAR